MTTLAALCVYCGSSVGIDPGHRAAAARLGRLMAGRGVRLIYGGGHVGLMGVLADAVLAGGGRVTGVIPEHLAAREVAHGGLSELVVVDGMHARKARMFALADAVAVLPGGLGTLDEAIEVITWRQLGLHDKPVVLVDVAGYWRPFRDLVEHAVASGFAAPESRRLFTVVASVEEVFAAVAAEPPPRTPAEPEAL